MSEKIDLQQEALNALKDAGLGSNSLRQAFIKGYRAHAYRQPSQEEEHVAAVTMSGRMRSIFHLEESDDTAPKPLQGFTVTAPVQILKHNTGCWWERTITARIRDGSTIPVVLDHVYWNWTTGTPMHIHLDGIQRIRVIEDKHHQREENN